LDLLGEAMNPGFGGGSNLGAIAFDLWNSPMANLGLKIGRSRKIDPREAVLVGGDESFLPSKRAGISGEAHRKTIEEFTGVKKDGAGGRW
jgi:hypothetical protein